MRVVLCTRRDAADLALIADALRARGAEPVEIDSAQVPTGAAWTLTYSPDGFAAILDDDDPFYGITAVWQRVVVGNQLPVMAPGVRETCVAASERMVLGLLDSLHVFQMDRHDLQLRADNKPYQLEVAHRCGLMIPRTIITNDAELVRLFADEVGPIVTKVLVQPVSTGPTSADDAGDVVFTTALGADELAQLDGLDLCPMIFQEQLANRGDVRATVIGTQVIAAIHETEVGAREVDWRRASYAADRAPVWAPYTLPDEPARRLIGMVEQLGLSYGAADFIVRPDGELVFLELNAQGSFAFLGDPLARRIADAIAGLLLERGRRF